MTNLGVVFLTGLTTGGLSCLAVQGGLLASSVAHQIEQDVQSHQMAQAATQSARTVARKGKRGHTDTPVQSVIASHPTQHVALPIVLFLGAKLVAYTILGVLLGWLGSMLHLTPMVRAILQMAIGMFMVGTALRMLHVHPIFRYFALEPPAFLTRSIRRTAKNGTGAAAAPLVLGALTVLIPCGVTQAMMALALGSGSPVLGAAIMAAFTLGTSPVFFTLAYVATRLGARLEARFTQLAALVVLLLGIISIDGGLNLIGSPLSFASITNTLGTAGAARSQEQAATAAHAGPDTIITIAVGDHGYTPRVLRAKAGQPVKLSLVTNNTYGCTRAFVVPTWDLEQLLPETGTVVIDLPPHAVGQVPFTCSMGMYRGVIQFE